MPPIAQQDNNRSSAPSLVFVPPSTKPRRLSLTREPGREVGRLNLIASEVQGRLIADTWAPGLKWAFTLVVRCFLCSSAVPGASQAQPPRHMAGWAEGGVIKGGRYGALDRTSFIDVPFVCLHRAPHLV